MSEFKTMSLREVNGGWIVDTGDAEFIFTSFNTAMRKVREVMAPVSKETATEE